MTSSVEKQAREEKVKRIVMAQLRLNEQELSQTASFVDDLGADAEDLASLVMALEEAFRFEVADDDAAGLCSLPQVLALVEWQLRKSSAS